MFPAISAYPPTSFLRFEFSRNSLNAVLRFLLGGSSNDDKEGGCFGFSSKKKQNKILTAVTAKLNFKISSFTFYFVTPSLSE